jgi:hypothetical protein
LKITSFLVFRSSQIVSKITDFTPFCRAGLAPVAAEANQVLKFSSTQGLQLSRFSLDRMSCQICWEKEHWTNRREMDSTS